MPNGRAKPCLLSTVVTLPSASTDADLAVVEVGDVDGAVRADDDVHRIVEPRVTRGRRRRFRRRRRPRAWIDPLVNGAPSATGPPSVGTPGCDKPLQPHATSAATNALDMRRCTSKNVAETVRVTRARARAPCLHARFRTRAWISGTIATGGVAAASCGCAVAERALGTPCATTNPSPTTARGVDAGAPGSGASRCMHHRSRTFDDVVVRREQHDVLREVDPQAGRGDGERELRRSGCCGHALGEHERGEPAEQERRR